MKYSSKDENKINGQKMREMSDYLKSEMPGCGFALIAFDTENGIGNYISNVQDEFMIKTLEFQLDALKKGKTFLSSEIPSSDTTNPEV